MLRRKCPFCGAKLKNIEGICLRCNNYVDFGDIIIKNNFFRVLGVIGIISPVILIFSVLIMVYTSIYDIRLNSLLFALIGFLFIISILGSFSLCCTYKFLKTNEFMISSDEIQCVAYGNIIFKIKWSEFERIEMKVIDSKKIDLQGTKILLPTINFIDKMGNITNSLIFNKRIFTIMQLDAIKVNLWKAAKIKNKKVGTEDNKWTYKGYIDLFLEKDELHNSIENKIKKRKAPYKNNDSYLFLEESDFKLPIFKDYVVIKDSEFLFVFIGILFASLFILLLIFSLFTPTLNDGLIFLIWLTGIVSVIFLSRILIRGYGRFKFIISKIIIDFYINKMLILSVIWDDINRIEVIKEGYFKYVEEIGWTKRFGYRLLFKGVQFKKAIRLWCCTFHLKKEELILTWIMAFCKKLNKEFIMKEEIKTFSREETRSIQRKYENFRDYYRFKKKRIVEN